MRKFRSYEPDQLYLLPPSLREWLPAGHLALFVSDVVDALDLSAIFRSYDSDGDRGQPPYHPAMMVKLLVYAYCVGHPSSRKMEKATWDEVPFRVLSADQHPDHDSIASFRKRHLSELAKLFAQVLQLCQKAGLVKLGHVALDGTKVKANASKHKAMSYQRMQETEARLQREVEALLRQAEQVDAEEDARYGKGKRGDELPEELQRRESRLAVIRAAKAELEAEAKVKAEAAEQAAREKIAGRERKEKETGQKVGGKPPLVPDPEQAKPDPKAQKNFTDPESRIMKDGATKSFEQAYNAQAVVDSTSQVIVATAVTQQCNDKRQLVPMLQKVQQNLQQVPQKASADSGYFSAEAVSDPSLTGTKLYVAVDRQKHGEQLTDPVVAVDLAPDAPAVDRMKQLLQSEEGRAVYKMRKAIVEPVFGQIKEARGFRRFSFRGLANVSAEWDIVAMTHNLLKLFRSGYRVGAVCPA
jgi:transposase